MAVPEFYSGKILYPAIGVLIALSALFGLAILPRLAPGGGGWAGKPAPDFALPVVANGETVKSVQVSELKGRPVILDFWASWCGPCNVQAPILDRVARRYASRGLVVVGVDVDDPVELAQSFAAKKGLSYPIVVDERHEAQTRYGVDKLPTMVLIDKQGNVKAYVSGPVDEGTLEDYLLQTL